MCKGSHTASLWLTCLTEFRVTPCHLTLQLHVRIRRKYHWRPIPVALFLQLLPRLSAASTPLSQWRTRAVFAALGRSSDVATGTGSIVELELCSGTLHVRGVVGVMFVV